jgi:phosphatidate cytidylyltransferase
MSRPAQRRRNQGSDLAARILAAIPAIAFAVTIVVLGEWWFVAALIALGWVCLHEAFLMLEAGHPVRLAGFLGLAGMLVAAHLGGPDAVLGALAASVPVIFVIGLAQVRAGAPGLAVTAFGLVWIALPLAHAVMLRDLPHGGGIVAAILVGTFAGDTGAYFAGRAFGRRALAPRISPNKTVEGLVGGFLASILGVEAVALYQDWLSGWDALWLGLAVGAAAPVGDLFESYIKRDRGVKDAGRLFGAHGGALDRLDAVLFTAVAGYYVWLALL